MRHPEERSDEGSAGGRRPGYSRFLGQEGLGM